MACPHPGRCEPTQGCSCGTGHCPPSLSLALLHGRAEGKPLISFFFLSSPTVPVTRSHGGAQSRVGSGARAALRKPKCVRKGCQGPRDSSWRGCPARRHSALRGQEAHRALPPPPKASAATAAGDRAEAQGAHSPARASTKCWEMFPVSCLSSWLQGLRGPAGPQVPPARWPEHPQVWPHGSGPPFTTASSTHTHLPQGGWVPPS